MPSGPYACRDILLDVISQLDILCTDVHNKYNVKNFVSEVIERECHSIVYM